MRIFNITYIKYLLLFASLLFVPATYAQDAELAVEDEELYADSVEVKTDSVRRDPSGRIYPYPNQSAFAKDSTNHWLYLLQRPPVTKHYENKKVGDHAFLEFGLGFNTYFTHSTPMKMYTPGSMGSITVGDWITPEHGVRVGLNFGEYKLSEIDARAAGFSVDYMMNFTALGSRKYEKHQPWEFYGIAGLDFNFTQTQSQLVPVEDHGRKFAFGLRFGLRAQYHLNDYTYAYVEPRLGLYGNNMVHWNNDRGFYPVGSVMAGFGYRMRPADVRRPMGENYFAAHDGSFLNDMFLSLSGGPSLGLAKRGGGFSNNLGGRIALSGGKWFTYKHGARLTAQISKSRDEAARLYKKYKGVSFGADYLLNLHNAFGGYNPDRKFWLNAVTGLSLNATSGDNGHQVTPGFGAGVQANVRIAHGTDFFLEPRIDIYGKDYVSGIGATNNLDAVVSLMAGFTIHQGLNTYEQRARNKENFHMRKWWDKLEFEAGMGALMPISSSTFDNMWKNFTPKASFGVGKWLTATSGARLWAEAGRIRLDNFRSEKSEFIGIGLDYMWNATNTFHGYDPNRRAELITTLGANYNKLSGRGGFIGLNASVKGLFHIDDMWSIYVEPQIRMYKDSYVDGTTPVFGNDLIASLMAGVQLNTFGRTEQTFDRGTYDVDAKHSFVSGALGVTSNANELPYPDMYGFAGRFSFGHWFSPFAAWRGNISALYTDTDNYRHYAKFMLGADLLANVTAMAFGHNPDRFFSTNVVGGFNLGYDYRPSTHKFIPDVHAGLQFAFRLNKEIELYVEPQLAYQFRRPVEFMSNLMKFQPAVYFGMNYLFGGEKGSATFHKVERPQHKQYVSGAIGTGLNTQNFSFVEGAKRLTFAADVNYGLWFNGISGIRVGLSNTTIRLDNTSNKNLTSLHADYMVNLLALTTGERTDDKRFQMVAFAGLAGNTCGGADYSRTFGGGIEAGMQFGVNLTPEFEVFAEPSVQVMTSSIMDKGWRPAEADVKLLVGTKYNFSFSPTSIMLDRGTYDADDSHSFVSLAMGATANANERRYPDMYGFMARFSFGHWFNPFVGWRGNIAALHNNNEKNYGHYAKAMIGADAITDLHALCFGYKADRLFSTRLFGGLNFGVDYRPGKTKINPDVHAGLQFAFRVTPSIELFAEPMLTYQFRRPVEYMSRSMKLQAAALAGINYRFGGDKGSATFTKVERPEHKQYVSGAIGTGLNTQNFSFVEGAKRLTFAADVNYGLWFNGISGIRVGLSNTTIRLDNTSNKNLTSLHADYMVNLLALTTGERTDNKRFQMVAFAGLAGSTCGGADYSRTVGVGAEVGMQFGVNVAPQFEIFAEPSVQVMTSTIMDKGWRPAEADVKFLVGTKYNFSYSPKSIMLDRGTYDVDDSHSFVSLAMGATANANERKHPDMYGFMARVSFGHWFTPFVGWRGNVAALYNNNEKNYGDYAKGMIGADVMTDLHALCFGYKADRLFSTRLFGGLNFGVDYRPGKTKINPDVHAGLQFAFRVTPSIELFAEPMLTYQFRRPVEYMSRYMKVQAAALAGINYRFGGDKGSASLTKAAAPEKKQFVSAAIGTGLNTQNFSFVDGGKRFTFTADVNYGRWFNGVSGVRAGLSNSLIRLDNTSNKNLLSLHVDYLVNLLALTTGESTDAKKFQMAAFAGLSANTCNGKDYSRTWGVGVQAGVQLGVKVTPQIEVFAEPSLQVMSSSIMANGWRPAEADAKLMIGTKYSF